MTETIPAPPPIQPRHFNQTNLSFSQESLWFLQQLDPENIAYNSNYLLKFTGKIDSPSLERAINELVRRHEPFRTSYPNKGGRPVQVIHPFEAFSLKNVDLSGLSEDEQQLAVRRIYSEKGNQPFNLLQGPLVRFIYLHLNENENYLFFSTHHIGTDAWSRQIIFSELMQLYDAFRSGREPLLPELPIQYADFAAWQREWLSGKILTTFIDHWKGILSGDLPILELPTDRPRPVQQSFHGATYRFRFSQVLFSQMTSFCKREHLTLFHFLLAAYALLLARYTGLEDIIIGCPFANRFRPELNEVVGLFVNTLPIRINLSGNPSVRTFLDQVREAMLDAFSWQAAPFEALVSEISPQRDLSHTPIFQVVINLKNIPTRQTPIEGLKAENILREEVPSAFDISLDFDFAEDGHLEGSLNYNVDLYDENTIIHMFAHYQNLLKELLANSDRPIKDLEMLTPSEWQRIAIDWNNTGRDFPQVCIHDLIAVQTKRNPDWLAVVCNGNSLTYGDLEIKANRLAHYLRANGVSAEARVGLYLPRTENTLIALLAVLKAGGAYVPIDLASPIERINYMIEDSDPAVVITSSYLSNKLPNKIKKICLDTEAVSIDACESGSLISSANNDSLAYVMYTSGSTGRPKGAMNTHKGIVNYMAHMINKFQFGPSDRVIQFTSLSFDSSVWNVLGTLSYGGTVFFMDDEQMRNPDCIYAAVIDHQATYINLVPTMLRAICESAKEHKPEKNCLRLISCGGDVLREADVELARQVFGRLVNVNNQYGPTECSISAIHYLVPDTLPNGLQGVPIGKPISNARVYILDDYLHLVPQGVKGELFIGGIGVGRGYWNRPDLAAERFLPDPFWPGGRMYRTGDIGRQLPDGSICFLGRSDNQVKIRSYRVELGEIEAIVNEFSGVKDAVVVLSNQNGSDKLVAYITVSEGTLGQIKENLQVYLAERLPFYMLPSVIVQLEAMPLTVSGKVNKNALPLPETSADNDHLHAPRNDIETRLVSIWKEVLGIERVGVRDNFFELGGHSLLAVQLLARIQEEFGLSLPLQILFTEGTVQSLAEALARIDNPSFLQGITPIRPEGSKTPLFIISPQLLMRDLALTLAPGHPVYGLAPVENGKEVYRKSVQDTAIIYYHNLVDFYPQGPYLLIGHSGRGLFTLELARVLLQNGKDVAFLGLLDTRLHSSIPPVKRLKFHANNLMRKNLPQMLQYTQISLRRFSTRASIKILNPKTVERYQKEGRVQVQEVMHHLMRTYVPKPYPGQVTLFSIANLPSEIHENPIKRWAKTFTGQFNIVTVPGDHVTMLKQPHVAFLAEKIDALLPPD
jgi:amino acid adenylation domain-containing protein